MIANSEKIYLYNDSCWRIRGYVSLPLQAPLILDKTEKHCGQPRSQGLSSSRPFRRERRDLKGREDERPWERGCAAVVLSLEPSANPGYFRAFPGEGWCMQLVTHHFTKMSVNFSGNRMAQPGSIEKMNEKRTSTRQDPYSSRRLWILLHQGYHLTGHFKTLIDGSTEI